MERTSPSLAPVRRLTLLPLVGALYFMVSGGPYGIEDIAHDLGFFGATAVFLILPFIWSLPTAFMVGELAAAHPDEGGFYVWVKRALGPFWGFQEAWLSFAASIFDMAIYPTLFALYLGRLFPALQASPVVVGAAMAVFGAVYNLAGARAVAGGSAVMTAVILVPFLVLSVLAVLAVGHPGAVALGSGHAITTADWASGLLVAMWNTMGWDNASTVAGEVRNPERNYPVGVLAAVALVTLGYVVPLMAMYVAHVDPSNWTTGSWVDVARLYGGPALAVTVVAGGVLSSFAMYNALCLSYSRLPEVLAEDGFAPRVLAMRRQKNDAPWVAIIVCACIWTVSLGLPFERLVSLDILLYGTSLMLEFVALIVLRIREPTLARPFRVPGGMVGAVFIAIGPFALLLVALVKNADEHVGSVNALVLGAGVALLGPVAYAVARWMSKRRAEAVRARGVD